MAGRSYTIGSTTFSAPALPAALHLVSTPIGNLRDITIRALEVLAAADILACEDTRTTRVLLNRYGISRGATAYHEHNADQAGPKLIAALQAGQSVALVSDAGTPLVSDPGFRLVAAVREAGFAVVPIPGPSAPLAALAASGLATDSFFFAGFLPHKAGQRLARLKELERVPATLIFFEAPGRAAATLAAMAEVYGPERTATLARELTKAFEEIVTAPLGDLAARHADTDPRGEIVLLVSPPDTTVEQWSDAAVDALLGELAEAMPASKAAAEAARQTGRPKTELYRRLTDLKHGA